MVAVDERGECFCGFVFFYILYLRFWFLLRMVLCVFGLLSFSVKLSFCPLFLFVSLLMGALLWVKSLFYDLEAELFLTVLSFW